MANMDDPEVVSRLSQEMAQALGQSLVKIGSEMQKLDRISRDAVSSSGGIGRLDSAFASIGTRLLGPVGLIAGLYQVSNALSGVAAQSVQMQAFSRNTGMASENVKDFQLQLQMMGKTSEEAKNTIASMNGILNNFATYKEESSLAQTMYGREGGAAFLNRLTAAKDRLGQIDEILKTYRSGNEQQKRGLADVFTGGDVDILDRLVTRSEILRFTFQSSDAELRKYHESTVLFETNVSNAWKAVAGNAIAALNQITGGTEDSAKVFSKVVDIINKDTDSFSAKLKATIQEIRDLVDIYNDLSEGKFGDAASKTGKFLGFDSSKSPIANAPEDRKFRHFPWIGGGSSDSEPRYPQAEDPMGADYSARSRYSKEYWNRVYRLNGYGRGTSVIDGGGTSGATDFSGMRRTQSIEEDQSKTLVDIRDILQRMEGGVGGSGSRETSGASTGEGGATTYGIGARGGSLKSGLGGFRQGGGGTRADRNNNPGNIEYGDFAKRMGATGSDGRFAIFPDRETGFKAAENLLGNKNYAGKTLAEIGARWAEGDPKWAANVSKATGIPIDAVPTEAQRSQIARTGIPAAEGSKYSTAISPNGPGYVGGSGDGLPSAVLDEARKVAQRDGPGAVQSYIRSQGYQVNSAWCGDFAAAVVRGSGGTPPKNPQIASNWRNYGTQVDSPQPGDIAVKKQSRYGRGYVPTGQTGSHVTIVDQVGEDGRFTGIGGNQGRRRANFPTSGYEYYRGTGDSSEVQAARARMDAAKNSGTENSLKAIIDFNNVPSGVKTNVETEGEIFKDLQVSKSKQNEVAGGSPGQPFSGVW